MYNRSRRIAVLAIVFLVLVFLALVFLALSSFFLVLDLLVIDGFDDSGFAGSSFLVLLVLALLVLGGSFSGSSCSFLVLLPKAIGIFQDNDTIFRFLFLFLSFLYSINHQRCKSHEYNTYNNNTNLYF